MIRTETATVVFTDIVGSTELASRLGHDAYEGVRRAHFETLRLAASIHQGVEIKSTGDGLVFAFTSAAEAVGCMIRMQRSVDQAARRHGGEPRIRVGASSGEATRDGNDIFGVAVVEAARLCATASPEQILVSDLVRALTRGLGYRFAAAGDLVLKGLPEPVCACTIEWESDEARGGGMPLPPKMAGVPVVALCGREAEQAIIRRCWTAARRGQRQLVLLAGEPGIGKTRLGIEAARRAHREGAIALFGACDEDIVHSYRPFVEALRYYVMNAPDDQLLQHVHEHRGELLRIVPELAQRVPNVPKPQTAEAETERFLMFEAVTGLLAAASQQSPIVLVLDDLQWAAAPELLLLKHIIRSPLPMRLLVVATYRDVELSRKHPLTAVLADLRRETGIERIAVRGLDESGVIEFVTTAAGHELDEQQLALARLIGRETEGSPLFIGEILRNLTESGAVVRAGDRWEIRGDIRNLGIPEGVKEAIGRRLSRLSDETNRVLSLASVIGREFDLTLLTQIAETSVDGALDALDEAKSAALITEVAGDTDRYAFTHVLMRAALYDEINPARRARMHQRAGAALEQLSAGGAPSRLDELSRHWMAATNIGDAVKAVGYARQAGDKALAGLAFEEAATYYEQALAALDPHDRGAGVLRCDLLIALGEAQRRSGDAGHLRTVAQAVEVARSLGDARRLALAALDHARPGHMIANGNVVDERLIALYEEAIAAIGDHGEDVLRARLLAQLAGELLYTPRRERRMALSREAIAVARRCGDKAVLAQVLNLCAAVINHPTTLQDRLEMTAELGRLADELGNLETRWTAAYQRFGALLEAGDIAGAEQMLGRLNELAPSLRQAFFSWPTSFAAAMMSMMRGLPDAEQAVAAAFQVGTAGGEPDARILYLGQLFVIRRDQGRYGELVETLRGFVDEYPHLPVWRVTLAGLYCETDQLDEARAEMQRLAAGDYEIPLDWTWASAATSLAQVCRDIGDRELAARFYPQLQPVAGQVGVSGISFVCYGSLAFPCGLLAACLARFDDAERYFHDAVATNERIGARPYLVRSRRAYADMLLARDAAGDRAHAAGVIAAAHAEAAGLGMQREIVRLERLRRRIEPSARGDAGVALA